MKATKIKTLLKSSEINQICVVKGWVKTFRANRFIALNDGSSFKNLQCVVDFENLEESLLKRITTGAAVHLEGKLVESQGGGQKVELQVEKLEVIGDSDPENYQIQPKNEARRSLVPARG